MSNEENHPEWLKTLKGESPLLSRPEWVFISDVRSHIMKEIKSEPKISNDKGVSINDKLSFMKDNFKLVVKHLKMNRTHRQYFMDVYPKWRVLRDCNIENLKNIANSIQEVRQKCQTANFIGSCISLIGGGICLAGGLRSDIGAQKRGSVISSLGSITYAGSSVIEVSLLHSKIKEAEKILKEDEECSKHLWEWLSDNSHLQKAMNNIRYIDVEINWKLAANDIQKAYKKRGEKSEVEKIIKKVLNSLKVSRGLAEEISDVIGILIATSMLYDRYRPLFDLAFTGTRLTIQLHNLVHVCRAAAAVSSAVSTSSRAGLTDVQKTRVAAGMVLDIFSILLCCKDFKSESKQAAMVTKASGILEKETEIFEKLFAEVEDIDDDNIPQPPVVHI